ncbi:glycoside hydrolase family 2 protein [Mucilaginibacter jinjuensis]|uniref:Glycoside hydrolase family 2 TIM barrel-domain containing protein n=1 Tax=Mucilaginibacter jinjuensis TaxID=1176721 RepID=A0ABY7T1Y8_9SPHI|nr:glycoside hydrolase family 2 TIM barrel-domain containing protein [Mucilaginibacter jinjuensis]WCT10427.1 glycoside hydrolase family 2 TIM barrel-domain containing protein [Mucilaginibacter jinjuensis]
MNKRFFAGLILALFPVLGYSQHQEYTGTFAPSESLVKPAEKPYRDDLCLNGSWQFQPVELPAGFKEGIDPTPELPAMRNEGWNKTPIRIPSPWNVNSFADNHGEGGDFRTYPSYPKLWETIKMGWLKRNFIVPQKWDGKRIVLHFEAVAGDAEFLINGKSAGHHFGIFLPFDIDVTNLIHPGAQNEIAVGIRKASLFDKRGEYGRRTYQAGSFWGQHIAGIWQDVYLEALPQTYTANVYIQPKLREDKLQVEATIINQNSQTIDAVIGGDVFQCIGRKNHSIDEDADPVTALATDASLTLPVVKVKLHPGENKIMLSADVKGRLKNWSTDDPNLYGLVLKTNINGKTIDQKYTRFGWREITFEGNKVLLNGKPIVMKGDSWHFMGIPQMTRRYAVPWFTAMRNANLNAVRLHAQPYPSFYLDVADEMGILVLDETAIWASDGGPKMDDQHYWADTKNHVAELVIRDRNHPSVFGWSVSNEVMPVVTNVMHNPSGVKDTLVKYYGIWADICRRLDPSRPWVSADGEDDGEGRFPDYIVHYGGPAAMDRGQKSGKPWGVGEAGNAYYGTPEQVAETNGDRAYESFLGRMEGVAADSYQILVNERKRNAIYRSVFNMVWYGLKPLPLGLRDTMRPPKLSDGIWFTAFKENQPGVQPERLGPYTTTLNPGYDPALPLYETWPLFEAIKDAGAEPLVGEDKWVAKKLIVAVAKPRPAVKSLNVIAGESSTLSAELKKIGVPLNKVGKGTVPQMLFVDGAHPPKENSKAVIDKVLHNGGTVWVWAADSTKLQELNTLLPAPLSITNRSGSGLLPVVKDSLTSGISNADLYFSELKPAEVVTCGLVGPLVKQSNVLLEVNHTDWLKWNKQAEYAKTAMIVRSEREAKPSGVVLIKKQIGNGTLIITTLPSAPKLAKAQKLVKQLLINAGIPIDLANSADQPLSKDGTIVRELFLGNFPVKSLTDGEAAHFVDPAQGEKMREGVVVNDKVWSPIVNENKVADLSALKTNGPKDHAVAYLSFWVSSSRSLEDLLIEPNIPVVKMKVAASDAAQVFLNGKMVINNSRTGSYADGKSQSKELPLRQGWNHFLIKLIQVEGKWQFSGQLTSNQPEFLSTLVSSLEKP